MLAKNKKETQIQIKATNADILKFTLRKHKIALNESLGPMFRNQIGRQTRDRVFGPHARNRGKKSGLYRGFFTHEISNYKNRGAG